MKRSVKNSFWITATFIRIVSSAVNVSAAESTTDKEWKFGAELYFWGASVGGKSASGSDIDVDVGDILSSVEFAFMGTVGARKGKWSLAADVIYLNAEDSDTIAPGLKADVELTNWVITSVVVYNLVDTGRSRLDILGGARYLYIKADLKLDALGLRADDSGSNWDAVIGARGTVDLTEKWYLFGYLDIGTGESKLTWQGLGGVGYRFKWFDLVAAYRYLRWNFNDSKALEVVSKAHLTLNPPKVHPPQAGGQVAVLWPFLVNVRGALPLTLNTYAHVYCVFSSIHAMHLGVI